MNTTPLSHLSRTDWALLTTAALAGGVILSPFVLPAIGIGSFDAAAEIMSAMHGTGTGSGAAGALNAVVNSIPAIGPSLAAGGLFSALATGIVGLGGMAIGHHIEATDNQHTIPWGRIIRVAALATSALIALPSILTGISVGIAFLADTAFGLSMGNQVSTFLATTLGTTGSMNAATATSSLGAMLPHLLTCGASLLPLSGVWAANHHGKVEAKALGIGSA